VSHQQILMLGHVQIEQEIHFFADNAASGPRRGTAYPGSARVVQEVRTRVDEEVVILGQERDPRLRVERDLRIDVVDILSAHIVNEPKVIVTEWEQLVERRIASGGS